MIHLRRAVPMDAGAMADLLNAIIARGGTTAHVTPVTRAMMESAVQAHSDRSVWTIAEDESGELLGFQMIEPHPKLPPEAADIATFTKIGKTQTGIGSALFEQTTRAARALGYQWINATIRADNISGLAYYQSRGFEDYKIDRGIELDDWSIVDKISKRLDL